MVEARRAEPEEHGEVRGRIAGAMEPGALGKHHVEQDPLQPTDDDRVRLFTGEAVLGAYRRAIAAGCAAIPGAGRELQLRASAATDV